MDPEVQVQEVPDRREAIEAAFDAAEKAEQTPAGNEPAAGEAAPVETPAKVDDVPVVEQKSGVGEPAVESGELVPDQQFNVDKAPQAWRAPQKAKWAALDADIRQEVMRRERETTRVLGETAQARQFAQQFAQVVQPFQARLQSLNAHPMAAVKELLQADYVLSSAPQAQRAAFLAKMIKEYGVDISALDSALAGTAEPPDPVASKVEQIVQQRLAPFQQYMQQQRQREQLQEQQTNTQINQTIEQMAANPAYPHFDALREDMADLIDIASKRGQYLTLEQAYTRAIGMNPEVSKVVTAQQTAEAKRTSAERANAAAQKALSASVSVTGGPSAAPSGTLAGSDRRATIEAAFDALGGR